VLVLYQFCHDDEKQEYKHETAVYKHRIKRYIYRHSVLRMQHIYHYTQPYDEKTTYGNLITTVNKSNFLCREKERSHDT